MSRLNKQSAPALSDRVNEATAYERLRTVIDPETQINIVDMGLIYSVKILPNMIHVLYTLTTPGCPLAGTLQAMIWQAFADLAGEGFQPERDIYLELTFDPPWTLDAMSEEARAELGF